MYLKIRYYEKATSIIIFNSINFFWANDEQKSFKNCKKNVEVQLTSNFNSNSSYIIFVDKGTRKVEDKSQGIGNQL